MKPFLSILFLSIIILTGCKKDKYTTAPQLSYKSVSPNFTDNSINSVSPVITFNLTDAEGDIGFSQSDTSYIYMKNLLTGKSDSLPFPDISGITKSDFKADILASVGRVLDCRPVPGGLLHIDTLYFEVYVKDFAGNTSNTITTGDPIFYECQ